jgi:hypothetical protein
MVSMAAIGVPADIKPHCPQISAMVVCAIAIFTAARHFAVCVGNLPPMPGVFPDYPAPVVRNDG